MLTKNKQKNQLFSLSLYDQFVWEMHEIFEVKVVALKITPIFVDIQGGHKTWTMYTKRLFKSVKYMVLLSLTDEKR